MRLRVPDSCRAASLAGCALEITGDQSVEVQDDAFEILAPHGFILWEDWLDEVSAGAATGDQPGTSGMSAAPRTMGAIGTEDIRAMAAAVETSMPSKGSEEPDIILGVSSSQN